MRRHFYNLLLIECKKFKSGKVKNMLPSYTTNKYCFHIVHVVLLTTFLFFFYFLIFQIEYIFLSIFLQFYFNDVIRGKVKFISLIVEIQYFVRELRDSSFINL